MPWLEILDNNEELGNKLLHRPAKKVKNFQSTEILFLKQRMTEICKQSGVAGIAAPQLGKPYQMFALAERMNAMTGQHEPIRFFFNAKIKAVSEQTHSVPEGCLSVPGKHGMVERHRSLVLEWQDELGRTHDKTGKPYQELFVDFDAQAIQHETDHCNGTLYIDKTDEIYDNQKMEDSFQRALQRELEAQALASTTKIDKALEDEDSNTNAENAATE